MAKIIEVILSERFSGMGTAEDPCRNALQLWTKNGVLLLDVDPLKDPQTWKRMYALVRLDT